MRPHAHPHAPALSLALALFGPACAYPAHDYRNYVEHMPRSILVLPPRNETPEVNAPYIFLSTITRPLAERGYYVFPVAVVEGMMQENGLPTPEEMNQVSLEKIDEIFGADAVLYVVLHEWGTTFQLINSRSSVRISCRLVDVKTGLVLWEGTERAVSDSSSQAGGGQTQAGIGGALAAMIVAAVVQQVASSVADPSRDLAFHANQALFLDRRHGMLPGHYHPDHERELLRIEEETAGERSEPDGANQRTVP